MYWIDGETLNFFVLMLLLVCCIVTVFVLRGRNCDGSAGWGKLFFSLLLVLGAGAVFCIGSRHEYWAVLGSTVGMMAVGIAIGPGEPSRNNQEI